MFDPNTVMSIADAKLALKGPQQPVLSVGEAKRALLGSSSTAISTAEAKMTLLLDKSQQKMAAIDPYAPLVPEQIPPTLTPQSTVQEDTDALLTNEESDSFIGGTINVGLSLVGGAAEVVGGALTLVPELYNFIDKLGIDPEEYMLTKLINDKLDIGEELTEAEQYYYDQEKDGHMADIVDIAKKSEVIDAIHTGVKAVQSWQNTAKQQAAMVGIKATAEKSANAFSNGNYLTGFSTFFGGVIDLAIDNPAAALEFTVNSLPQMIALAYKAVPALAALSVTTTGTAIKEFEAEYGRAPNTEELLIAGFLSTLSAGADLIGAKFTLGGKSLFAQLPIVADKLGLRIATSTLAKASSSAALAVGKTVAKPISSILTESATEGTQNVLTQLAAKQDLSKVSGSVAISDAIIGGTAGGYIAGSKQVLEDTIPAVKAIGSGIDKVRGTINKVAASVVDTATSVGIGKTDAIIAKAFDKGTPALGIKAILDTEFDTFDHKTRLKYITDLDNLIANFAVKVKDKPETYKKEALAGYEVKLDELIDLALNLKEGAPVQSAVTTLQDKGAEPKVAKAAAEKVVSHINTTATLPLADIDIVLGSDSSFRDNATPEQIKVVEDYRDFHKAIKVVKNADNVEEDVFNGPKGINNYLKQARVAIVKNDSGAINKIVDKLKSFADSRIAKLDPNNPAHYFTNNITGEQQAHTTKIKGKIQNELTAIQAAHALVSSLANNVKAEPNTKVNVSEEKKAETKPKAKPKVKAKADAQKKELPKEKVPVSTDTTTAATKSMSEGAGSLFKYNDKGQPVSKQDDYKSIWRKLVKGLSENDFNELKRQAIVINDVIKSADITTKELIKELALGQLSSITISREDGDKTITFNAEQELATLDNRLDKLEEIWTNCKI